MRHPFILSSLLLTLAACGGGGDDDGGGGSGESLGLLLTDAPTDTLSVFALDLTSVTLLRADGSATGNLLAQPRSYDVLSLAGTQSLLGMVSPPPGTYVGVRVAIDPASVRAVDNTGAAVGVTVTRATDDATFLALDTSNLVVGAGFRSVRVDIDLSKSLSDDPGSPGDLLFELEVEAEHEFEDSAFDEFRGRVVSEDKGANRFVADLLDDTGSVTFGRVTVIVGPGDQFIGDDRQILADAAAFFAALTPGAEVEVHGSITASGTIDATRVEIEDGLSFPVKIKGELLAVDPGLQQLQMVWREVRRGSALVYPVLAQLGNPRVLTIAWDGSTVFSAEDGGTVSAAALVPGVELYAHFVDFAAPMPFLAAGLELDEDGAGFEGTITDVSGLPGSFVLQLDLDEPSWTSGSISAPATVVLAGLDRLWLDVESEPDLQIADLLTGLKVEVHGTLSGAPNAATIAATKLQVKPGRLEGVVTGVQSGAGTFTLTVTELDDPFGGTPPVGATVATVPSGALLENDDGSLTLAGLASMFASLGGGESLVVRLYGIGDGSGDVTAWEVEADVDD